MVSTGYIDINSRLRDIETKTSYYTPTEQNYVYNIINKNISETIIIHNKENIVLTPFQTIIVLTDTIIKNHSKLPIKLNQELIKHGVTLLINLAEIPFPFNKKTKKSEHLSLQLVNMSNRKILIPQNSQIATATLII